MGSYEKVNYSLRPAKAIERKMLLEVMKRLSVFNHLDKYRYVGFGSPYFADFTLIHKTLGINKLVSIEKDIQNSERFHFNQPFSCIQIHFDHSNSVLPLLTWSDPTILWLDYDGNLQAEMFQDIATFFSQAVPGSMFLISVNVQPDSLPPSEYQDNLKKLKEHRLSQLIKRVGKNKLPIDIEKRSLSGDDYHKVIYEIIIDQINEGMKIRNGGFVKNDQLSFSQMFNILYNDNAKMLTIGGIVHLQSQNELIKEMRVDQLPFISKASDSFKIQVPSLTLKEMRSLDANLPDNINIKLGKLKSKIKPKTKMPIVSAEDIINYAKIYRYFPTFAEAVI
jgi:hypothetical protein